MNKQKNSIIIFFSSLIFSGENEIQNEKIITDSNVEVNTVEIKTAEVNKRFSIIKSIRPLFFLKDKQVVMKTSETITLLFFQLLVLSAFAFFLLLGDSYTILPINLFDRFKKIFKKIKIFKKTKTTLDLENEGARNQAQIQGLDQSDQSQLFMEPSYNINALSQITIPDPQSYLKETYNTPTPPSFSGENYQNHQGVRNRQQNFQPQSFLTPVQSVTPGYNTTTINPEPVVYHPGENQSKYPPSQDSIVQKTDLKTQKNLFERFFDFIKNENTQKIFFLVCAVFLSFIYIISRCNLMLNTSSFFSFFSITNILVFGGIIYIFVRKTEYQEKTCVLIILKEIEFIEKNFFRNEILNALQLEENPGQNNIQNKSLFFNPQINSSSSQFQDYHVTISELKEFMRERIASILICSIFFIGVFMEIIIFFKKLKLKNLIVVILDIGMFCFSFYILLYNPFKEPEYRSNGVFQIRTLWTLKKTKLKIIM